MNLVCKLLVSLILVVTRWDRSVRPACPFLTGLSFLTGYASIVSRDVVLFLSTYLTTLGLKHPVLGAILDARQNGSQTSNSSVALGLFFLRSGAARSTPLKVGLHADGLREGSQQVVLMCKMALENQESGIEGCTSHSWDGSTSEMMFGFSRLNFHYYALLIVDFRIFKSMHVIIRYWVPRLVESVEEEPQRTKHLPT